MLYLFFDQTTCAHYIGKEYIFCGRRMLAVFFSSKLPLSANWKEWKATRTFLKFPKYISYLVYLFALGLNLPTATSQIII